MQLYKVSMNNLYKQIYKQIKKYDNIVIARHIGPDPDSLGSQLALRDIIKTYFPKKNVYAVGNPASRFKQLGTLDKLEEQVDKLEKPIKDKEVRKQINSFLTSFISTQPAGHV